VHTVCSDVGVFVAKANSLSSQLSSEVTGDSSNMDAVKSNLIAFLSDLAGATKTFMTEMSGAGTPKVSGGAQVRTTLLNAINQLNSDISSAKAKAQGFSTSNSAAFESQVQALANQLSTQTNGLDTTLKGANGMGNSALISAAESDSACSSLGS
jgi:hypothetical protein